MYHRCTPEEVADRLDYHDVEPYSDLGELIEVVFDLGFGVDLNGAPWREGYGHERFRMGVYRERQRKIYAAGEDATETLACALIRALDKEEGTTAELPPAWPW